MKKNIISYYYKVVDIETADILYEDVSENGKTKNYKTEHEILLKSLLDAGYVEYGNFMVKADSFKECDSIIVKFLLELPPVVKFTDPKENKIYIVNSNKVKNGVFISKEIDFSIDFHTGTYIENKQVYGFDVSTVCSGVCIPCSG